MVVSVFWAKETDFKNYFLSQQFVRELMISLHKALGAILSPENSKAINSI